MHSKQSVLFYKGGCMDCGNLDISTVKDTVLRKLQNINILVSGQNKRFDLNTIQAILRMNYGKRLASCMVVKLVYLCFAEKGLLKQYFSLFQTVVIRFMGLQLILSSNHLIQSIILPSIFLLEMLMVPSLYPVSKLTGPLYQRDMISSDM